MNFPFEQEIILENDRALLRPLHISDFSNLLNVATSDSTLLQYSPMQIYTESLLEFYISTRINERENNILYPFIIYDKQIGAYAGCTSYLNISNAHDRIEIGTTWIGKEFQQTGLNRNCKFLLLQYAFETLHAVRVAFLTDERNIQSRTAIEKIGGKFEGILRKHTLMSDGFRRNTVCYSILDVEWEGMKPKFFADFSKKLDAEKYSGILKLEDDPLDIQKRLRDEWE
jgi:N-acetyltransferase